MKFIDTLKLTLKSGKGGPGCSSFNREPFKPRGGPDGGDGGRGGDVIFKVNPHLNTLFHLRGMRKMAAKNGAPGTSSKCYGAAGEHLIVEVPPGTVVKDEEGQLLLDLLEGETTFLTGGKGGLGNWHFKNSVNQAPTYAQPGLEGEEKEVSLELRLIADVGVLGFPNAGKSTLVSALTAAKPKIADYPFTTLEPQLGVVKVDDRTTFTIADIPGLIEGASEGKGLGHKFLQHIKRTRVFIHMLDVSDFSGREVLEDFQQINNELKKYDDIKNDDDEPLSERRQIVVFNKIDAATEDRLLELEAQFRKQGYQVIKISAVARKNLQDLISALCQLLFEKEEE